MRTFTRIFGAGLLRSIMRNPSARGILAIRHGTLLSRLDAWLLPVRELPAIIIGLPAVYRKLLGKAAQVAWALNAAY